MATNESLSPALLHAMSILIVTICVLQIAAFSGVITLVARNAALTSRAKFGVPLLIAASLAAWFGWAVLAVHEPVVAPEPPSAGGGDFKFLLKMRFFFFVGIAALFFSQSMCALCAWTPPPSPLRVHVYR